MFISILPKKYTLTRNLRRNLQRYFILNRFMTRLTDTVYLLHHGRKKMCFKVPVASLHYSVDSTIVPT